MPHSLLVVLHYPDTPSVRCEYSLARGDPQRSRFTTQRPDASVELLVGNHWVAANRFAVSIDNRNYVPGHVTIGTLPSLPFDLIPYAPLPAERMADSIGLGRLGCTSPIMSMPTKRCYRCSLIKAASHFYQNSSRKDNLSPECKIRRRQVQQTNQLCKKLGARTAPPRRTRRLSALAPPHSASQRHHRWPPRV